MQNRLTQHKLLLLLGAALLLASCMVGPNYVRPATPVTPAYKEPPPQAYQGRMASGGPRGRAIGYCVPVGGNSSAMMSSTPWNNESMGRTRS